MPTCEQTRIRLIHVPKEPALTPLPSHSYEEYGQVLFFLSNVPLPVLVHLRLAKTRNEAEFEKVFKLDKIFPSNHDALCRALVLLHAQNEEGEDRPRSEGEYEEEPRVTNYDNVSAEAVAKTRPYSETYV